MDFRSKLKGVTDKLFGLVQTEPDIALNESQMKAGLIDMRDKIVSPADKADYDLFNGVLSTLDIPDTMTDDQARDVLDDLVQKLTHRGFINEDLQATGSDMLVTSMMSDIERSLNEVDAGKLALNAIRFDQNTEQFAHGGRVIDFPNQDDDGPSQ